MIWSHLFTVNMTDEEKQRIMEEAVERAIAEQKAQTERIEARLRELEAKAK
jgi:predicted transcriptional regulator